MIKINVKCEYTLTVRFVKDNTLIISKIIQNDLFSCKIQKCSIYYRPVDSSGHCYTLAVKLNQKIHKKL